jgi:hypothetical protein
MIRTMSDLVEFLREFHRGRLENSALPDGEIPSDLPPPLLIRPYYIGL